MPRNLCVEQHLHSKTLLYRILLRARTNVLFIWELMNSEENSYRCLLDFIEAKHVPNYTMSKSRDHNMNLSLLFVFGIEISVAVLLRGAYASSYAEKSIRLHLFFTRRVSVYKENTPECLYIDANLPYQNFLPCFCLKFQSSYQVAWWSWQFPGMLARPLSSPRVTAWQLNQWIYFTEALLHMKRVNVFIILWEL